MLRYLGKNGGHVEAGAVTFVLFRRPGRGHGGETRALRSHRGGVAYRSRGETRALLLACFHICCLFALKLSERDRLLLAVLRPVVFRGGVAYTSEGERDRLLLALLRPVVSCDFGIAPKGVGRKLFVSA